MAVSIQIDGVSKQYRLGVVGTGTLSHDLHRAWARLVGQPDPFAKVGEINDREKTGGEYVWALRDIHLEIHEGEILGIIGRNGAGKSTLLKILSRITAPTAGFVRARGRIASLLEVGTGFHPELTGRDNIFLNGAILGMTRREIARQLDAIVEFSGCAKYIDTPVKRYSSGMTVRLGFAVAAHLECEILIVDEVLAVGDAEFQRRCIGKMQEIKGTGRTILFVSHNLGSIQALSTRVARFESGTLRCVGKPDEVINEYVLEDFDATSSSDLHSRKIAGTLEARIVAPTEPVRCHDPVGLEIVIDAIEDESILEMALLIYSVGGQRLAVLDLRELGSIHLERKQRFSQRINIKSMPFVEGTYLCGLYLRTAHYCGNSENMAKFGVYAPLANGDIAAFPTAHLGIADLQFDALKLETRLETCNV